MAGLFTGSGGQSQTSTTNQTTSKNFPDWYNQFVGQTGANAQYLSDPNLNPFPWYKGDMFAPFNATQNAAFQGVNNAGSQTAPLFSAGAGALSNAQQQAQGYFNGAGQQQTASQAGAPYNAAASTTWNQPGVSQGYMNPFLQNSVNYGNQLASQNFLQNTLPGINNEFVSSGGGLGSKQYGKTADFALKNFNNALLGNTQQAMSNGYFNSANLFNQDASRLAGLGQTAGNQAAQSMNSLGQLAQQVAGTGVQFGGAYGNLAQGQNNTNLANLNAQLQVGNQQQQQAQNPLTFAYQQQQAANQYPYQLVGWGANIAQGLNGSVPTTQNTQGTTTTTGSQSGSPSPLGGILGGLGAIGSIFGSGGAFPGALSSLGGLFGSGQSAGQQSTGSFYPPGSVFGINNARGGHIRGYFGGPQASEPEYYDTTQEPLAYKRGGGVRDYAGGGLVDSLLSLLGVDKGTSNTIGDISNIATEIAPFFLNEGGRVGFFGGPRASRPDYYERPDSPRRGYISDLEPVAYFAAGGHAPVVKAVRAAVRRDVNATNSHSPLRGNTRQLKFPSSAAASPGYFGSA